MARVTKDNVEEGMIIWSAYDDRPVDGCGYSMGKVTDVFDDHYLFYDVDHDIKNVWGEYPDEDDEYATVKNFTTEEECFEFLGFGEERA